MELREFGPDPSGSAYCLVVGCFGLAGARISQPCGRL